MLLPAVIGSIIAAALLVIAGTADVILATAKVKMLFLGAEGVKAFNAEAILLIISAIDAFLIATVMLIFGIGLYELFVSQIDDIDEDSRSSGVLEITSLDQLKNKLGKVIIMVLVVTFFKTSMKIELTSVMDLLMLSGGIVLTALALFVSRSDSKKTIDH